MNPARATATFVFSAAIMATWSTASLAADPIKFDFVGTHGDKPLTLHVQKGWTSEEGFAVPEWMPLCTAPCSTALPAGTYRFGISVDGGAPVPSDSRLALSSGFVMRGSYVSNSDLRLAGYGLMVAGPALGAFIYLPHLTGDEVESDAAETERKISLGAAIGVAVAGFLGGMAMTVVPDRSNFEVLPMGTPVAKKPSWGTAHAWSAELPVGLEASYRF